MLCFSCVEPYDIETDTFEDFLVVEALLTDKVMFQEIKLSRTYPLEDVFPTAETNANVSIIDDMNLEYKFNEVEPGKYLSEAEFSALPEREYTLSITTNTGRKYSSKREKLVQGDVIDFNLYTQGETNAEGAEGVAIYYENIEPGNEDSRYFRFEYVETYKIVPPYWYDEYLRVNPNGTLTLLAKENEDGKVCFGSEESNEIILRNSSEFALNEIEPFLIKFNKRLNAKIQSRYSLLVKQHLISREAYTYYETLKDFSESESLFSENQPGTVIGNLYSVDNPNETVIGFFEVAKTLEKRVFFSYEDFFYNSQLFTRPYFFTCDVMVPFLEANASQEYTLAEMIEAGLVILYAENFNEGEPPYQVVKPVCGDCSTFADIEVPDFWEE